MNARSTEPVLAGHVDSEFAAHDAARAVGSEQIARFDLMLFAGGDVLDLSDDMRRRFNQRCQPPAEAHADACLHFGVPLEHGFERGLRNVLWLFRRAQEVRRAALQLAVLHVGAWPLPAAEFVAAEARHIGIFHRHAGRQGGLLDIARCAEPAKMLHRARIGAVALGVCRGLEPFVDEDRRDATPAQRNCRGQADRTAADNQDKCFFHHESMVPAEVVACNCRRGMAVARFFSVVPAKAGISVEERTVIWALDSRFRGDERMQL